MHDCFSGYWGAGLGATFSDGSPAGMFNQTYVVPVDGEALGMEEFYGDLSHEEAEELVVVSFSGYIADCTDRPSSVSYDHFLVDYKDRRTTITVEYLEGSTRFGDAKYVQGYYQPLSVLFNTATLVWVSGGEYARASTALLYPEGPVPQGPVKITYALEGYTTDSAILDLKPHTSFGRGFLISPDHNSLNPGPGPSDFRLPPALERPTWPYPVSTTCTLTGVLQTTPNNGWFTR